MDSGREELKGGTGRVPRTVPEPWNRLVQDVIGAAIEVHSALGPGLLERIYEDALGVELGLRKIPFERQVGVRVQYKGVALSEQRLDMVIGGVIVVELKSMDGVPDSMLAQLVSYMKSADKPLGLLMNFHGPRLKDSIYRRINPECTLFGTNDASASSPICVSSPRSSALSASSAFTTLQE